MSLMESHPLVSIGLGCVVLYLSAKLTFGPNQGIGIVIAAIGIVLSVIMIIIPIESFSNSDPTDQILKNEISQTKDEKRIGAEKLTKAVELIESEGYSVERKPTKTEINEARALIEQAGYRVLKTRKDIE